MLNSCIIGYGSYLPEKRITNDELAQIVDTSDAWIRERTGIQERRFAAENEFTSDLATKAAQQALDQAKLKASDIDLVIVATVTPDETFPATATRVQANLGVQRGVAFDVAAACSGFLVALATANNALKMGQARRALVIGAETFSRILDMQDRRTCVLFGDGAGAVILEAQENEGIFGIYLESDGRFHDLLYTDGGASSTQHAGFIRMEGQELFRHAVTKLSEVTLFALGQHQLTPSDIDWIIPHQANQRIIEAVTKKLNIENAKVVLTLDRHANTSAASIPLALTQAAQDGRLQKGNLILLEAIGAGLIWGAAVIRW